MAGLEYQLLGNQYIRDFLKNFWEEEWEKAIKCVVILGIHSLREDYPGSVSLRKLEEILKQKDLNQEMEESVSFQDLPLNRFVKIAKQQQQLQQLLDLYRNHPEKFAPESSIHSRPSSASSSKVFHSSTFLISSLTETCLSQTQKPLQHPSYITSHPQTGDKIRMGTSCCFHQN